MPRNAIKYILLALLLTGFTASGCLVFRPWFRQAAHRRESKVAATAFLEQHPEATAPTEPSVATTEAPTEERPLAELYATMQAYNEKIYAEGQRELYRPGAYVAPTIDFEAYGLDADAAIGVLEIPAIGVRLPIYPGASTANLSRGAALLSQTSFPLGGENTNAVIGAHRSWDSEDYLRDIEAVQVGDAVIVTNFWETLHYTVAEVKIIEPNDIDQILIQPGRDLLTVFTCHPYASGGRYRYLLICERAESKTSPATTDR